MAETVRGLWDNDEKTCYRIEFLEGWAWQDFSDIHIKSYAMLGQIDRRIDLIVVFLGRVPKDSSMGHLSAGGDQPPNMRHTVFVNSTDLATKLFVKTMIGTVVDMHEWVGPHFVDSLEDARAYLAEMESKSEDE